MMPLRLSWKDSPYKESKFKRSNFLNYYANLTVHIGKCLKETLMPPCPKFASFMPPNRSIFPSGFHCHFDILFIPTNVRDCPFEKFHFSGSIKTSFSELYNQLNQTSLALPNKNIYFFLS